MDPDVSRLQVILRLGVAVVVGAAIGFDRSERGRTVGMRTTILVCLAAALAMIEANLLLGARGRTSEFFAQIDPLRLPLGILSGIGFIGAGAIVRRGEIVQGLTTATTLWLTTVIGLAIGAGDIAVGVGVGVLAIAVLRLLRRAEIAVHEERTVTLMLRFTDPAPDDEAIRRRLSDAKMRIDRWAVRRGPGFREVRCDVTWKPERDRAEPPAVFNAFEADRSVIEAEWTPKD
jgi:putative Mg2+ transporter-C (MgtC) family protein